MKEVEWVRDFEGNIIGMTSTEEMTLEEARKRYPEIDFTSKEKKNQAKI